MLHKVIFLLSTIFLLSARVTVSVSIQPRVWVGDQLGIVKYRPNVKLYYYFDKCSCNKGEGNLVGQIGQAIDNAASLWNAAAGREALRKVTEGTANMRIYCTTLSPELAAFGTLPSNAYIAEIQLQNGFENYGYTTKEAYITHEMGHVLGLRHEDTAEDEGSLLIGSRNPDSVMDSVRKNVTLNAEDFRSFRTYFRLRNREEYDGRRITAIREPTRVPIDSFITNCLPPPEPDPVLPQPPSPQPQVPKDPGPTDVTAAQCDASQFDLCTVTCLTSGQGDGVGWAYACKQRRKPCHTVPETYEYYACGIFAGNGICRPGNPPDIPESGLNNPCTECLCTSI